MSDLKSPTQQVGHFTESKATHYLQKAGCKIKARNFTSRYGEIDLVVQDKEYLVFVEVRYRTKEDYGSGAQTVTHAKQKKLIRTAQFYLQSHRISDSTPCRFDVVSLTIDAAGELAIDWIKDAFQMEWTY